MNKLKVYIYPNAKRHVHDDHPFYYNTVPFSEQGLKDWCVSVPPECADYFYMGQISDSAQVWPSDFPCFYGNESRHIADIEGDWGGWTSPPEWLRNSILTINSASQSIKNLRICVRPTFSSLLLNIIKERKEFPYPHPIKRSFCFRGFSDPWGVRARMAEALTYFDSGPALDSECIINKEWTSSSIDPLSNRVKEYEELFSRHSFALCPRGMGHDSVRFYESCYFGLVPILIGSNLLVGDPEKFYFRIDDKASVDAMYHQLSSIIQTPDDEIEERSIMATTYFEYSIRTYFDDPTKWAIDRLRL